MVILVFRINNTIWSHNVAIEPQSAILINLLAIN